VSVESGSSTRSMIDMGQTFLENVLEPGVALRHQRGTGA